MITLRVSRLIGGYCVPPIDARQSYRLVRAVTAVTRHARIHRVRYIPRFTYTHIIRLRVGIGTMRHIIYALVETNDEVLVRLVFFFFPHFCARTWRVNGDDNKIKRRLRWFLSVHESYACTYILYRRGVSLKFPRGLSPGRKSWWIKKKIYIIRGIYTFDYIMYNTGTRSLSSSRLRSRAFTTAI